MALFFAVWFSLPAMAAAWKYGGLWFECKADTDPATNGMFLTHIVAPPDSCPAYSGEIFIPDSVVVLDATNHSFYNKKMAVARIDDGIFANVTSVNFDDECTSAFGFTGCTNLTSVTLGKRTKTIADNAFKDCTNLTQINLSSITSIGDNSFAMCNKLKALLLPCIESVGAGAFENCAGLTTLEMPNGTLQVIGTKAFENCENLQTVTIRFSKDPSITSRKIDEAYLGTRIAYANYKINIVGSNAFNGCVGLKSFIMDDTGYDTDDLVKVIFDPDAFNGCIQLDSINSGNYYLYLDFCAFEDCTSLKHVSLTTQGRICGGAFTGCNSLQKVYLGQYAEVDFTDTGYVGIGHYCPNLKEYEVNSENACLRSINGALYDISATTLVSRPAAATAETLIVPNSVTKISCGAFSHNKFKQIQLHTGIREINDRAFLSCKNLLSITIPEGITIINGSTFWGCDSLQSITIPKSVTSLSKFAFAVRDPYSGNKNGTLRKVVVYNPDPPYDYDPINIRGGIQYYYPFGYRNIYDYCTLYVPAGSKAKYHHWGYSPLSSKEYFNDDNIIEMEDDGVGDVVTDRTDASPVAYYDLQGHKYAMPQPGLNIVRYGDGTAKKVLGK